MGPIWILLLLTANADLAISAQDPHLCVKTVEVPYTVTERASLDEYGDFGIIFKHLNVLGEMLTIPKTKVETREVCCDGYEPSEEGCRPVPMTTTGQAEPKSTPIAIDNNPIVPLARTSASSLNYSVTLFAFMPMLITWIY